MLSIEEELQLNVSENRKDFVQLVVDQEEEITDVLQTIKTDVSDLIAENTKQNKINDRDQIVSGLNDVLKGFTVTLGAILLNYNIDALNLIADRDIAAVEKYKSLELSQKIETKVDSVAATLERTFLTKKSVFDKISIGSRIKTIEKSFINATIAALDVGIRNGDSAETIAKQIDRLVEIDPANRLKGPFQIIRERFGTRVVSPSQARGSVSYNSLRIARTEIAETYRNATILLNQDQPWVKGFQWKLSRAHPKQDICDKYKDKIFQTLAQRPYTHPNCMCYLIVVYYTIAELKKKGII